MKAASATSSSRGRFDGMLQIARFNWPHYAGGLLGIAAAATWLTCATNQSPWLRFVILVRGFLIAWWCVSSLLVSHWIYDRSSLYRWSWIPGALPATPRCWLNLHAGLDESTLILHRLFPGSHGRAGYIYAVTEMSEPSIRRARIEHGASASESVSSSQLPVADGTFDAVFVLFAAHELRRASSRESFFRELHRVVSATGTILLVEHTRDLTNFVAFGPGTFHFFPIFEWRRLARVTGLQVIQEQRKTPFVKIMLLQRSP